MTAVAALARNEAGRLLRNPALLAGAAVSLWLALPRSVSPEWTLDGQFYARLSLWWAPLHLGAFLAAVMVALRDGEEATAETFAACPLGRRRRTRAVLLAGLAPTALTAVLVAAGWLLVAASGGIPTGRPEPVTFVPTVPDALHVICLTATAYAGGIALVRRVRSGILAVAAGLGFTYVFFVSYWIAGWFPAYFLGPYVSPTSPRVLGVGDRHPIAYFDTYTWGWYGIVRDTDLVAWHTVYLAGAGMLLAAYALHRRGRLMWLGALLAVTGFLMQIPAYSGTWALLGSWWAFLD